VRASVVICTRNRSGHLGRCLEALEAQTVSPERLEVVVVDNGSTDETPSVVEAAGSRAKYMVRRCVEERVGLSNARNRGVAEARHEIVVFLDDDALPGPDWLAAHLDAFETTAADCVGGRIRLEWEAPRPTWLHPVLDPLLGRIDLGEQRRPFAFPWHYPAGGNIAFRREVFEKVGLFDPAFGVRPGEVVGSEETDLCYRLEHVGGRLIYEPRAQVTHPVAAAKLTRPWLRRRAFHAGRTACLVELKHLGPGALIWRNLTRLCGPPPKARIEQPRRERGVLNALCFLAEFRLLFACGYFFAFLTRA